MTSPSCRHAFSTTVGLYPQPMCPNKLLLHNEKSNSQTDSSLVWPGFFETLVNVFPEGSSSEHLAWTSGLFPRQRLQCSFHRPSQSHTGRLQRILTNLISDFFKKSVLRATCMNYCIGWWSFVYDLYDMGVSPKGATGMGHIYMKSRRQHVPQS